MNLALQTDAYLPFVAKIVDRTQESATIFTLHLQFLEQDSQNTFTFYPGQFNMVSLYGVGEIAISIVSDPDNKELLSHTIRAVGRVSHAMQQLTVGEYLGIRGPFGRGWPLKAAEGKDILIITGGLGCAPSVSIVNYIIARREQYGDLYILQGVKHSQDFIFKQQYDKWRKAPRTTIHIAADQAGPRWPFGVGYVTDMLKLIDLKPERTVAMMCGPEMMMYTAINALVQKQMAEENIYLSMERNMECGIGHCGHCQYGGWFVCKDGPIFSYSQIKALFHVPGF